MAEHKISAVPVLVLGRHVGGMVSEADLLSVLDKQRGRPGLNRAAFSTGTPAIRSAGASRRVS